MSMGLRKVSGHDNITAGILEKTLPVLAPKLMVMYGICLDRSAGSAGQKKNVLAIPMGDWQLQRCVGSEGVLPDFISFILFYSLWWEKS